MKFSTDHQYLLCSRPICTSAGDWALCPLAVRIEKKISDSLVFSFSSTIRFLARSSSVMVRMHGSIFPFPPWFPTGLSICSINRSRQNGWNRSERNDDPGSVGIRLGTPKRARACDFVKTQIFQSWAYEKKLCFRPITFFIYWNYQIFLGSGSDFERSRKIDENFIINIFSNGQFAISNLWLFLKFLPFKI